jgi:hypothetical protein
VPIGGQWDLSWSTVGDPALLLVAPVAAAPLHIAPQGWLFIELGGAQVFALPGGKDVDFTFDVPGDPAMQGAVVHLQMYDPALDSLSRPVVAAVD